MWVICVSIKRILPAQGHFSLSRHANSKIAMNTRGQGYYRWLASGPSEHERTDTELTEQIREIHTELHGHPACAGSGPNWSCAASASPASGSGD